MTKQAKESTITTLDDTPEQVVIPAAVAVPTTNRSGTLSGDRVELRINSGSGAAEKQGVFAGLNGDTFNIPRDKYVIVPRELAELLENTTITEHEPGPNGTMIEREVTRFSMSVREIRTK